MAANWRPAAGRGVSEDYRVLKGRLEQRTWELVSGDSFGRLPGEIDAILGRIPLPFTPQLRTDSGNCQLPENGGKLKSPCQLTGAS